jgi:hypothetical protein
MLWLAFLAVLALGGILFSIEGALIGLWRVWFNPEAPLLLRLMLPGTLIAFAVFLSAYAWSKRRVVQKGSADGAPL